MDHGFFYITWTERCVCIAYLRNRGGSVMFWPMFCWETSSSGLYVTPTCTIMSLQQRCYLMPVTSVSRIMIHATLQKNTPERFEEHDRVHAVDLDLTSSQSAHVSVGRAGQTSLNHGVSTSQCTGCKGSATALWCQIPQHTFRGCMQSRPPLVRAASEEDVGGIRWW